MQNEFYAVVLENGENFFFKDKDKAFAFLWQEFLNANGHFDEAELKDAKDELFDWYMIEGFGEVNVCGFED